MRKYGQITWADLSERGILSPVLGLNAVPLGVVAAWLGADTKEVQAAKQRCKSDLENLGAFVATGKQVYGMLGMKYPSGANDRLYVRSACGDDIEIPVGKVTYLTAPAVARLKDEVCAMRESCAEISGGHGGLQVFSSPEFGKIRTVKVNGEPWLVLKDVCSAFGETNYRRVAARLEEDEKGVSQINTPGGPQNMTVVNEPGLYSALFVMQPEKARGVSEEYIAQRQGLLKKFKRWVTSEVLPAIRKTGGYIPSAGLSDAEIMARALMIAQNTINEKDRTIARQAAKIEEDKPKVAFADMVRDSSKTISIGDFAQMLRLEGGPMLGRNKLFEWMRDQKILKQNNHPYQKYINQRLFEVVPVEKYGTYVHQTRLTGKGQLFLQRELDKYFCVRK